MREASGISRVSSSLLKNGLKTSSTLRNDARNQEAQTPAFSSVNSPGVSSLPVIQLFQNLCDSQPEPQTGTAMLLCADSGESSASPTTHARVEGTQPFLPFRTLQLFARTVLIELPLS